MTAVMAVSSLQSAGAVYYFDGAKMITDSTYKYYRAWSQDMFPWHNTKPSDAWEVDWTNRYGCSLMAMAKMFVEAGVANPKTTNPKTIMDKYGTPSKGIGDIGIYWSNLASHFGMTCESFQYYPKGTFYNTAMSFFNRTDRNYHLLLRVALPSGGSHYVQVDRQATIDSKEIVFNDSTNTSDGGTRYNTKEDYWKNCALKTCSDLGFTPMFFVVFYNNDTLKIKGVQEINSTTGKISWYPNGTCQNYIVYRRNKGATSWKRLANIKHVKGEGIRSYTDKTLKMGQEYQYTVRGVYRVNGKEYAIGYNKNGVNFVTHPDPPQLVSAKSVDYNKIQISWKSVDNADGYKVFRKKNTDKEWTAIKTGVKGTSYTDTTAKCGQKYYYTVRAYKGKTNFLGAFDKKGLSATAVPKSPRLKSTECIDFSTIKICWDKVEGASGYYILRKTGTENYEKIGQTTGGKTEFSDLSPICGTKYTYTVKAYRTVDGKNICGVYPTGISGTAYTTAPQSKGYTSTSADKLTLRWDKVKGASGYILYRKTPTDKTYKQLALINGNGNTSYTDEKLKTCTEYSYKLRSYRTVDKKKIAGYLGEEFSAYTHPAQPVIKSAKSLNYNTIEINWSASTGATGYGVYRKTEGKSYSKIAELQGNKAIKYQDKEAVTGTKYTYTVRAFSGKGEVKQYSTYNRNINCTAYPLPPKTTEVKSLGYNALGISWEKADGATGYYIYRKKATAKSYPKAPYAELGEVTSYTDNAVACGEKYTYAVKTVRNVKGKNFSSDYSASKSAIPVTNAPTVKVSYKDYKSLRISWSLVDGADGYRVYHKKNGDKKWTAIATFGSNTLSSCVHTGIATGIKHTYTVRGYRTNVDKKIWGDFDSKGVSKIPVTSAPRLTSAKNIAYKHIKVEWQQVDGAEGYKIYRKLDGAKSWSALGVVKGKDAISYVDKNAVCGKKYHYTVRAYRKVGTKTSYGLYNKTGISAMSLPEKPLLTVVSDNYNKIKIRWSQCYGATGYKVYKKTVGGSYYLLLKTASPSYTTYIDTVECGVEYSYYVTAYKTVDKVEYGSYDSDVKSCKAVPQTAKLQSVISESKRSATISWTPVTGASGYHIYRKEQNGKYANVADVNSGSGKSFVDQNLESGKKYTYTVVAYRICPMGYIKGTYNKTGLTVTVK